MKRDFTKDFNEIQNMCSKIRSLNESVQYADEYDDDDYKYNGMGQEGNDEMPDDEGMQAQGQEDQRGMEQGGMQQGGMQDPKDAEDQELQSEVSDPNSPINAIREIALKGMVRLCKTPEDPEYDVLKKVFSMIDKANDKKKEGE